MMGMPVVKARLEAGARPPRLAGEHGGPAEAAQQLVAGTGQG